MAPLALHEKVLVSQEFFRTGHAEMTCEQCHGGNPAAARTVGQYQGLAYHPLQMRAGHIENSVNLPTMGFWTAEGFLKDPRASAWLLESRGITKDKRIIVTCTTGQAAAGAWWALKYLGYPNVVLHDGSWVSWERSPMMKK